MNHDPAPLDLHNRALLANVRPDDWRNPQPDGRYNLVVIGAGSAGLVTAAGAAGLGAKVALIEKHLLGGDCLNVGCVPSKLLLRSARAAAAVRDSARFGVRGVDLEAATVDFPAVMKRMRSVRAELSPHDSARRFRDLGVDVYLGEGRFTGPDAIEVAGQELRFRKGVIATGARPTAPPIPGLTETGYLTNETVFSLESLPRRLAVIGGGAIGCELAQAFARFGSEVTIFEESSRILPRSDVDASEIVYEAMMRDRVRIRAKRRIASVSKDGDAKVVRTPDETFVVDEILVATGRAPNIEGLGLETAGVGFDSRGIQTDDRLRTANRRIFAAGDVCGGHQFTHAADAMARIVIQNALFLGRAQLSALTMPWCIYTDPEIAGVGLDERTAQERGIRIQTYIQDMMKVDRAVLDGDVNIGGFVKIHVRAGTDRIVGATIAARHAGEMISTLTLAIASGQGLKALSRVIFPYPTQAEAIRKVADSYNRTRLTPRVRTWFERWLRWTR